MLVNVKKLGRLALSMNAVLRRVLERMPKAELHIHIEGSLEPELLFALAERNGIEPAYESIEELRRAYAFKDLQSFLDVYYAGTGVLLSEEDFYDMTWAYLQRAKDENVRHAEIFFDPQIHAARGIAFSTVVNGIHRALCDARAQWGMSGALIMSFLRHLSENEAFATLEEALPHRDKFIGVGLDSSELGHPPEKFARVFARCKALGLRLVAHAGEEGPPAYIQSALDVLHAERIDHGVRCLEDRTLVQRLVHDQIPLTVCPLSNVKLHVFDRLRDHNMASLLEASLLVTVNSDDPAYFGGYVNANLVGVFEALSLTEQHAYQLAVNGFRASFLDEQEKRNYLNEVEAFFANQ
jgi:adenosine deaminase